MTVDFTQPVLSMPDGSYVVTLDNGWPYNVVQGDSSPVVDVPALWKSIQIWLASGNTAEEYQPPAAVAFLQSPAQALATDQTDVLMAALPGILLQIARGDGTDPLSVALKAVIAGVT